MNNSSVSLREASLDDLKIILEFTIKLHFHEQDTTIKHHLDFSENLKKWLASELTNPRSLYLLADKENASIGFIGATSVINDNGFLANPIKGIIQLLWVEARYRKNQIANQLVDEVEHCFKEIGITDLECSYTAKNQLAEDFWSSQGYVRSSITAKKQLNRSNSST